MPGPFRAVPLTDRVYWVGAVDWNIRDFHGYTTRRGSTYNAYLILGEPAILVDTVKAPFRDEMFARIASVVDPARIRVLISNHAEEDHSGSLPETMRILKPDKVYASQTGVRVLREIFRDLPGEITGVQDGEQIAVGDRHLTFLETRMLHWPDSMFTYFAEEEILFSQDAFGMHLATAERFDDEVDEAVLRYEAATYYANILLPYSPLVTKLLQKVGASGLSFKLVAPDHGPVWRTRIPWILDLYGRWASQKPSRKAVVVYATMWRSTERMAAAIVEGLLQGGVPVKRMCLDGVHRSDVLYELLGAGAVAVGSSTLNNNLLPQVADLLIYMKGLRPKNLLATAFGSYGWSGEAAGQVRDLLAEMKLAIAEEPLRVKNAPTAEDLERCLALGKAMASRLRESVEA